MNYYRYFITSKKEILPYSEEKAKTLTSGHKGYLETLNRFNEAKGTLQKFNIEGVKVLEYKAVGTAPIPKELLAAIMSGAKEDMLKVDLSSSGMWYLIATDIELSEKQKEDILAHLARPYTEEEYMQDQYKIKAAFPDFEITPFETWTG